MVRHRGPLSFFVGKGSSLSLGDVLSKEKGGGGGSALHRGKVGMRGTSKTEEEESPKGEKKRRYIPVYAIVEDKKPQCP